MPHPRRNLLLLCLLLMLPFTRAVAQFKFQARFITSADGLSNNTVRHTFQDRTGYEVTRRLKDNFPTSHIPIILLTALNTPEHHYQGIEAGADAYITKPFSVRLLLIRIVRLLEQRDKLNIFHRTTDFRNSASTMLRL